MNIKQNDTVVVDGKTARVQTWWGAGAHLVFKLDDGREILDLDKAVANGSVQITNSNLSKPLDLSILDQDEIEGL